MDADTGKRPHRHHGLHKSHRASSHRMGGAIVGVACTNDHGSPATTVSLSASTSNNLSRTYRNPSRVAVRARCLSILMSALIEGFSTSPFPDHGKGIGRRERRALQCVSVQKEEIVAQPCIPFYDLYLRSAESYHASLTQKRVHHYASRPTTQRECRATTPTTDRRESKSVSKNQKRRAISETSPPTFCIFDASVGCGSQGDRMQSWWGCITSPGRNIEYPTAAPSTIISGCMPYRFQPGLIDQSLIIRCVRGPR